MADAITDHAGARGICDNGPEILPVPEPDRSHVPLIRGLRIDLVKEVKGVGDSVLVDRDVIAKPTPKLRVEEWVGLQLWDVTHCKRIVSWPDKLGAGPQESHSSVVSGST